MNFQSNAKNATATVSAAESEMTVRKILPCLGRQKRFFLAESKGFDLPCAAGQVACLECHRHSIQYRSRPNPLGYKKQAPAKAGAYFYGGE